MANAIAFDIKYLLNIRVEKLFLLKENHSTNKPFNVDCDLEIIISDNMNYCIDNCDIVIIIQSDEFPERSKEYIINRTSLQNKKLCLLNEINVLEKIKFMEDIPYNSLPVILNISNGIHSQQLCLELLLNKIFSKNNITIRQVYSQKTYSILNQLRKIKILNKNLECHLESNTSEDICYDLIVFSMDIGNNMQYLIQHADIIKKICPDFVIYQTGYEFCSYELIKKMVNFVCGSNLDMLVKSNYYRFDNDIIVHLDKVVIQEPLYYSLESNNLLKELEFNLFSKLSFPEGVIPIN